MDYAEAGDTIEIVYYPYYQLADGVDVGDIYTVLESHSGDVVVNNKYNRNCIVCLEEYRIIR